jgi:hypothetical protein
MGQIDQQRGQGMTEYVLLFVFALIVFIVVITVINVTSH